MEERENSNEDKTEEATDERRKQFREEGKLANPREIVHSLALLLFVISLYVAGQSMVISMQKMFSRSWVSLRPALVTTDNLAHTLYLAVEPLLPMILGICFILVVLPLTVGLIFTQFNWTWKRITFDWNNINIVNGLGRIFSTKALPELIKGIAKLVILSAVAYRVIGDYLKDTNRNLSLDIKIVSTELGTEIIKLLFSLGIASLFIGFADWAWSWWQIEQQLRMTKQELKEDIKSQEGDPHVKGARKRMARDFALNRSMQQVPKATFVVTNPEHFAVAIRYQAGQGAPVVVAKGMDFLALRIKEIAKKSDIIIVENKPLARTLYKTVKVGEAIPQSLYASIVEVMKYIRYVKGHEYFNRQILAGDKV